MNVTDANGRWRLTSGFVTNRKTGEVRAVQTPSVQQISHLSEAEFARKCAEAFDTGTWPN